MKTIKTVVSLPRIFGKLVRLLCSEDCYFANQSFGYKFKGTGSREEMVKIISDLMLFQF